MMLSLLLLSIATVAAGYRPGATGHSPAFQFPDAQSPQPFEIHLEDSFVDDVVQRVRSYRPITGLSEEWTTEGPPRSAIEDVADYWGSKYSWKSVEQKMNRDFHHYATTVPGSGNYTQPIPLHFIHHPSKQEDAIPLLLLHGWPSTFLEWSKVVKPLSKSFHVVAPDLPGFGFSPAPEKPGLGPREMGKAFDALMHQLGYTRYGIATTDLGWITGMWMVHDVRHSIIGHWTDFYLASALPSDRERLANGDATPEEAAHIASVDAWFESPHWLYSATHGQKPLVLSLALADSPVGFLGWYWDVNYATSDGFDYSHDQLITDAMMLWIPGPFANIRAYSEMFKPYVMSFPSSNVPTGVSEWGWENSPFPQLADFAYVPEDWIKRTCNLVYFKRHNSGGHFPAVTQPTLYAADVKEFFSSLQKDKATGKDEL